MADDLVTAIPSLRAFANSLCGDRSTADDLVQETLVKAWNRLDSFEPGTNLKAWLFTILRNTYFSDWRKRSREVACANGMPEALETEAEQPGYMDLQDFRIALQKLPAERREALILTAAVGFSCQEAAKICGCSTGTIKSRVSRARAQLAGMLERVPEPETGASG